MSDQVINFSAVGTHVKGFKVEIKSADFIIKVDEPKEIGGSGEAPNPIQYLLASLIGCFIITTVYHAKLRRIKIGSISVKAQGKLDLRGFSGEDNIRPGLQEIVLEVSIDSNEKRERILELLEFVEKHCPVGDTISRGSKITVKLA